MFINEDDVGNVFTLLHLLEISDQLFVCVRVVQYLPYFHRPKKNKYV